jgi:flagellar hook-associated protein 3
MTNSITGIPTTRVTELFTRDQILRQSLFNQLALSKLEEQLSSGYRFQTPSDDPIAAMQVVSLQRLIQRKDQVKTNLETTQSYLNATDSALSGVFSLLTTARSTALDVISAPTNETQRQTAAQQINQTIDQLLNTGNLQFRGRYLFSGSESLSSPFLENSSGMIEYLGNDQHLMSYSDLNLLTSTNVTGNEAFGAISSEVKGTQKVYVNMVYDTRLSDLRQGQGISKGSIAISDGTHDPVTGELNEVIIDLSGAKTIGDMAALIKANPPTNRQLYVDITADKLKIQLDPSGGGNLTIREVGSGTVAEELGIRNETGMSKESRNLDPILRTTTSLDNLFGAYATTVVHSPGTDNDVRVQADVMGVEYNNFDVRFIADNNITAGNEFVAPFDPASKSLDIHVAGNGTSHAYQVVKAINDAHANGDIPFSATIDRLDNVSGGLGLVQSGASASTGDSGFGEPFDKDHGLKIANNGKEQAIDFSLATTLGDVLNTLNGAGAGVLAEINDTHNGINLLSSVSGCDFEVGENGGKTAAQFGVQSMDGSTPLSKLNYGRGVGISKNSFDIMAQATLSSTASDANFTIRAKNSSGDPSQDYWNNFLITVNNNGANPPTVALDLTKRTLTINVNGSTTANDVVKTVNESGVASEYFQASIANNTNGSTSTGTGVVDQNMVATTGGMPKGNDFTITRSDGVVLYVDISKIDQSTASAVSVNDIIDAINKEPHNLPPPDPDHPELRTLTAQLNKYGNGIELVDLSGGTGKLVVTKNTFSTAAVDLGLVQQGKTVSEPSIPDHSAILSAGTDPQSSILIHGRNPNAPIDGTKVVFEPAMELNVGYDPNTRTLTVGFPVNTTADEVIDAINNNSTIATLFKAERAPIANDGSGPIENYGPFDMTGGSATTKSQGTAQFTGFNNDLTFTANTVGQGYENVQVQFAGVAGGPGGVPGAINFARVGNVISVSYDSDPLQIPTAQDIVDAWSDPANWTVPGDLTPTEVSIALDPNDGTPNLGQGFVEADEQKIAPMTSGVTVLSGADVNPQETQGIFTALLRMRDAMMNNDMLGVQRTIDLLDGATTNLNYTRAALGAREQGLQVVQDQLATENIDLRTALSQNHDVDFVQVISDLTARQTAYQASLMSLGKIMQMSLLNYL